MPVPDQIDIYYDEAKPPLACHSIEDVDDAINKLHNSHDPSRDPLAIAIKVLGHEIDTGLGCNETFLFVQIDPCDGEYYIAVGDRTDDEVRMFYGAGQDSYWHAKNLIPLESAKAALRYFLEHQKICPAVRWQDWNEKDV